MNTYSSELSQGSKRKRRKRTDDQGRDYICQCGKKYLSYPALYTHIKNKHQGELPQMINQNPNSGLMANSMTPSHHQQQHGSQPHSSPNSKRLSNSIRNYAAVANGEPLITEKRYGQSNSRNTGGDKNDGLSNSGGYNVMTLRRENSGRNSGLSYRELGSSSLSNNSNNNVAASTAFYQQQQQRLIEQQKDNNNVLLLTLGNNNNSNSQNNGSNLQSQSQLHNAHSNPLSLSSSLSMQQPPPPPPLMPPAFSHHHHSSQSYNPHTVIQNYREFLFQYFPNSAFLIPNDPFFLSSYQQYQHQQSSLSKGQVPSVERNEIRELKKYWEKGRKIEDEEELHNSHTHNQNHAYGHNQNPPTADDQEQQLLYKTPLNLVIIKFMVDMESQNSIKNGYCKKFLNCLYVAIKKAVIKLKGEEYWTGNGSEDSGIGIGVGANEFPLLCGDIAKSLLKEKNDYLSNPTIAVKTCYYLSRWVFLCRFSMYNLKYNF